MIKLNFLTDDSRWIELASLYWQYDQQLKKFSIPVEQIAKAIPADSRMVSKILAAYCQAFDDAYLCSRCGKPAVIYLSRADFQGTGMGVKKPRPGSVIRCPECQKVMQEEKRVEAERIKQAKDAQKLHILHRYKDKQPEVNLQTLSLEQALFLDAYGRAGLTEDLGMLLSLNSLRRRKRKLAPLEVHEEEIVQRLFEEGLIVPHPQNNAEVIQDMDPTGIYEIDLVQTHWYFPVSIQNPTSPVSLYQEIEQAFITKKWPEVWFQQVYSLWRTVAVWECLEYLNHVMDQHDLPFRTGEKTINTLKSLLTRFSTGQIQNFIWRAGRDAAAFYMRRGGSKWHAANTVVGSIQRLAERAEAEGWEVNNFRRNFDCPQSLVSQVLFDAVLKIGEDGFNLIPREFER